MPGRPESIAYRRSGRFLVAMAGSAGIGHEPARSFLAWASPGRVLWFGASRPEPGYRAIRLGREAIVAPDRFTLLGGRMAGLRHSIRAAERAGLWALEGPWRSLPARVRDQVEQLARESRRGHPFTSGLSGAEGATAGCSCGDRCICGDGCEDRWWTGAVSARGVEACVAWLEADHRVVLDLSCRRRDAPMGSVELAVATAVEGARVRGLASVSLGISRVPVLRSGALGERAVRSLTRLPAASVQAKFDPRWEDRYLLLPENASLGASLLAVARLQAPRRPVLEAARSARWMRPARRIRGFRADPGALGGAAPGIAAACLAASIFVVSLGLGPPWAPAPSRAHARTRASMTAVRHQVQEVLGATGLRPVTDTEDAGGPACRPSPRSGPAARPLRSYGTPSRLRIS